MSGQQGKSPNKKKVSALRGKQIKSESSKRRVEALVPLRRSARQLQIAPLKNKNQGAKKGPRLKSKKGPLLKPKRGRPRKYNIVVQLNQKKGTPLIQTKEVAEKPTDFSYWKMKNKRTSAHHSYWLDGLRLSRKPDDERVMQFRRAMHFSVEKVLAPSEGLSAILDQPICKLCSEAEHTSTSSYIACEICQEWFHGEAFGLNAQNLSMVIGFACHICRMKSSPVCPRPSATATDVGEHSSGAKCSEEASDIVPPLDQVLPTHESHVNKDPHDPLHKEGQRSDPISESNPGAENERSNAGEKLRTDAPQNSD